MSHTRNLLLLLVVLVLVVIVAYVDIKRTRRAETTSLVQLGNLSRAELLFHGTKLQLSKDNGHWKVLQYDGHAVKDDRVNEDLLSHVLDLVKALSDETTSPLKAADAPEYGMKTPELALTLGWDKPQPGEDVVIFGHRDLSGHRSFAFFPKRPLLLEVPSSAVAVLEGRTALDLRDRRITTFEPDDVEELSAAGKCGKVALTRDGDRWMSGGRVLADQPTETWLEGLLGTRYDAAEDGAPTESNSVCLIQLKGIKGRTETVEVFKADGTLWSKSTALPARYKLPKGFLALLVPPRAEARR